MHGNELESDEKLVRMSLDQKHVSKSSTQILNENFIMKIYEFRVELKKNDKR